VQAVHARVIGEPGVHDARGTNHGNAFSLYFRDPEGNRIEVFCDTPWYISQPCVEPLDLTKPPETIVAEAEAFCRGMPGFRLVEHWEADVAAKIASRG